MKSFCLNCNGDNNHKVLTEKVVNNENLNENWWEEFKYQIIECEGCCSIIFRKLYNNAQQLNSSAYEMDGGWRQEIFNKSQKRNYRIKVFEFLPKDINQLYYETIEAFNNKQDILCSAGIGP